MWILCNLKHLKYAMVAIKIKIVMQILENSPEKQQENLYGRAQFRLFLNGVELFLRCSRRHEIFYNKGERKTTVSMTHPVDQLFLLICNKFQNNT